MRYYYKQNIYSFIALDQEKFPKIINKTKTIHNIP
jgi:hypothetical protein